MPEVAPTRPLEQAKETCGVMLVMEGGVSTTANISETKERVIEAIQKHLENNDTGLLSFITANPDDEEIFLFDPKRILIVMIKKEYIIQSGKIVPVTGIIEKGNIARSRLG